MLLISNGRVLDSASGTDALRDILLDGDRIVAVAEPGQLASRAKDAEIFDAKNLIVAPGFIDLHCHLREPGGESSETIETGTKAAARGGFTAVCPMPNTKPVNDNASLTRSIMERAAAVSPVRVWPIGAASVGSKGEALAEIAAMKEAGIVAVSDDGRPIATAKLLRQVMEYCRSLDLPVIDHCEDSSLFAGAVMREGKQSVKLGLRGMPAATEALAVARDVQMGELTSARLHIAHLSATSSLELVRAAKAKGLPVTCEVTPHHFTLTDDDVQYDTRFKMNPPLASRADRDALIAGLADGTVDAIATDHAPHEAALKDVEFDRAPFGVTGFETAIGLGLELVHAGKISLMRMVELFTTGPASVLGKQRRIAENGPGDLTIFSTEQKWIFHAKDSLSKSKNSPFDGREFTGGPVATVVAGRVV
ncbi:MAG TPA: dihydroorotase, partial [Candidatus Acidoferrales bacterium]|nr:dihydroorotase [Candidatus Acidoferrales bacterium]